MIFKYYIIFYLYYNVRIFYLNILFTFVSFILHFFIPVSNTLKTEIYFCAFF